MKLTRVEIKNFRSIQHIRLTFDPACRVLVGINESGKSNILKALALMGSDYDPVKKDDLREALPDEEAIDEAYVRFVFAFEKAESDKLFKEISVKILASAKNPDIVSISTKNKSVKEFCATRNEGLYSVNIIEEEKSFLYWRAPGNYKLIAGWKKPAKVCPADFVIEIKGEKYKLANYALVRAADLGEVPAEYLEDATIEDLFSLAGGITTNITEENLPDTLFWVYDESNLLPANVKIADFAANPDSCIPLKNMFALAGITEIKRSIEDKRKGTDNQFQNYLDSIAKKTTIHFRGVWKEYKNIEFCLKLNADQIIPGIKEKNTHDFARRSDGFKRFATFLLMISVNVKTDSLNDTLLLIDEPDIGLHPSGARYLRDELIKISLTNYVVYSTHSIFMIDSSDVGRHYIVRKGDEITSIEAAQESNIADEEVLYNALGHSVLSVIKEDNIIFEGWKDKRLFRVALEGATAALQKKYEKVGICHAKGVPSIKTITPLLELAKRRCVIISDSDKPGKDQQKSYKNSGGFGDWRTYQDIDTSIEAITGEDFMKNAYIAEQVQALIASTTMPAFPEATLPDKKGKLVAISKWLTDNGMTQDQAKEAVENIKNSIFEHLTHTDIDDTEYKKLLQGISFQE